MASAITDYSTSEQNTGFKWIDGDIIYKKSVDVGNLPNNTTKSVLHNISNLKRFVKLEGILTHPNKLTLGLPWVSGDSLSSVINFAADATNINITTSQDRTSWSAVVTLFYTKN